METGMYGHHCCFMSEVKLTEMPFFFTLNNQYSLWFLRSSLVLQIYSFLRILGYFFLQIFFLG
jgi:hypothetical protein